MQPSFVALHGEKLSFEVSLQVDGCTVGQVFNGGCVDWTGCFVGGQVSDYNALMALTQKRKQIL